MTINKEVKSEEKPLPTIHEKTNSNRKDLRDKYREKVKGIFRFHEVPGGEMTFCYKEFKEDTVEKYTVKDGQVYEMPLGVARHLNKNGWYPKHSHLLDSNGVPSVHIGEKIRRFSFQSLDFTEEEI